MPDYDYHFRPRSCRIDAPWPLPASAQALADRLPDVGYDGEWRAG